MKWQPMHYYIDGYNLLFRTFGTAKGDLQQQRKQLIQNLYDKIKHLSLDVTIVFDAHLRQGEVHQFQIIDLKILFTPTGQNADEYILSSLDHTAYPGKETIVTSDKELAWKARLRGAHTESVEVFIAWLNKRSAHKTKKALPPSEMLALPESLLVRRSKKKPCSIQSKPSTGSLEYYLDVFEKKLHDEEMSPSSKNKRYKPTKQNTHPPSTQSEMARWLKIFEERDI